MTSIRLRYIAPAAAVISLFSSAALAQDATPPPADGAAPPPAADAAPPPAKPAAEKKDEGEPDPKKQLSPNSIFVELGGAAFLYSLNYERMVIPDLGVRAGFGYIAFGASVSSGGSTASAGYSLLSIPITASYLGIRSGKHALELGGGAAVRIAGGTASVSDGTNTTSGEASSVDAYGILQVGYRLHPVGRAGFQFRIGAMALVGRGFNVSWDPSVDIGVAPFGYLSLGASF